MTTIHTRIKQRREALGITMKALAEMVGVAAWQTVQQWEREDGTAPKRDRLQAVATALQTTPEELLFGADALGQSKVSDSTKASEPSREAIAVAEAFERLNQKGRDSVIALLRALDAL